MDSPVKLLQQMKRRVHAATYGSSFYRMMLDQGPAPERVRLSVPDPWPGDAGRGQALIANQPNLFEQEKPVHDGERKRLLAHESLRDLRAVGTDLARRRAVAMLYDWLDEQEESWDEEAWAPDVLGLRLANWLAFYDFYAPAAAPTFQQRQLVSMARQLRHLLHTAQAHRTGLSALNVVKGLVYGGLCLLDAEKAMGLALDLLARQLADEILPDGGTSSRNPLRHAEMLRTLIDIRSALIAGQLEIPHELQLAIAKMVPALKFFRHGDGGLALFHGGREGTPLILDAIQTLSGARGRLLKQLPQTGYERITAGRSLLLVDVGGAPPRPYDNEAHAGLSSFEFSVGRERLIVNCGAAAEADEEWRRALGATAAHSTVTLGDTNACELIGEGGIGHRPKNVTAQRFEQEGVQFVETTHDGYLPRQKVTVQRLLGLTEDGGELRGREALIGPLGREGSGRDFAVRWHLHPSVTALLSQDGHTALLRTASGSGWRLRLLHGGDLALESSIYCAAGAPRRTLQLRVAGRMTQNPTVIEWTLTKETIKKGN